MRNRHGIGLMIGGGYALACCVLLAAGCVGYRLGSMLPPGVETVYVPTVQNQTGEPFIESEVTSALIRRIQTDGSLRVVGREAEADTVLYVTLQDYALNPITFERGPSGRADEYRITLIGSMSLVRTGTGAVVAEHPEARGEATAPAAGDLASARRNAMPGAAEDLARDIVRRIVEYW